jgi:hypothetical protein
MGPGICRQTRFDYWRIQRYRESRRNTSAEKRAAAVVIMGKNQKKLTLAKSLQSEALRPPGFVEFVSASSRDFTQSER